MKTQLTTTQKAILGLALVPMIAVGVAGGIGTFTNISGAYGRGTAVGALAAGEGATAVLALLYLGVTLLGQTAPKVIRLGLWLLPAIAAVMGATAATDGIGQTIVYAATPMAITASAEGLAFLARRIVIHQEGRDAEAEARAAAVIRDLAYHQARAAAHPSPLARKRSVRISWRLARRVGSGDTSLGADLLAVQRTRLTQGADTALARMFTPGLQDTPPALLASSADTAPALPAASDPDAATPGRHDVTIHADTAGSPTHTTPDQQGDSGSVRTGLMLVHGEKTKKPSIAADVRRMVADGVQDVRYVIDAIATRHNRPADDPTLRATVSRYYRQFKAETTQPTPTAETGAYL